MSQRGAILGEEGVPPLLLFVENENQDLERRTHSLCGTQNLVQNTQFHRRRIYLFWRSLLCAHSSTPEQNKQPTV